MRKSDDVRWLKESLNEQNQAENEINIYLERNSEEKLCSNCEILFLKKLYWNHFQAMVRPGKKFKVWTVVKIKSGNQNYKFLVKEILEDWTRIFENLSSEDIFEILENVWKMPLPPYIEYSSEKEKFYQPVQAKNSWSVAAPTASLHFTSRLLSQLKNQGVDFLESTLHIGMWTFKTVDVEDITQYDIHSETVQIPTNLFENIAKLKSKWKKITAVWTTATRILESLPYVYKLLPEQFKNSFFDQLTKDISIQQAQKFVDGEVLINENFINFDTKLYIYPSFNTNL